jgi:multicomponent Na+:H+ antiporter subunit E
MNNTFGLNIILAIAWVAFTGSVSLVGLITGFVIGYGALWLI